MAAVIVATWVLTRTRFGNWIFSVGGSEQAARYVGVPVNRVRIVLFMTTAGSACLLAVVIEAVRVATVFQSRSVILR